MSGIGLIYLGGGETPAVHHLLGLGFVGWGFWVQKFQFRILVLGFGVWGLGFGLSGFGCRVQGFGCKVSECAFNYLGGGETPAVHHLLEVARALT